MVGAASVREMFWQMKWGDGEGLHREGMKCVMDSFHR